ncbi:MAG: PAS domain S-box protein [Anaeromyxobacteraceae bacterium]
MVQGAPRARPPEPARAGFGRYAVAVVAAAAGIGLKVALSRWIEPPFLFAFPAVAIAAIVGGLGPGLLATVLSALGTWLWVIHPAGSFGVPDGADLASMVLFLAVGAFVSALADRHRKARDRVAELERETLVRAVEVRARGYVDGAPVAIFVVDGGGRFVDFNPAALDMLCVDAATLLQMSIADITPPAGQERAIAEFHALLETGRLEQEYTLVRRDGRRIEVLLRAVRVAEDRFVAFCQDFTERRQAEERVEANERYLRTTLETALDSFWTIDREGRIVDVNAAACEMLGYSREELLRMRVSDVEALEAPAETAARLDRIRTSGFDRFHTRHRTRDGRLIDVSASVRLIDARGGVMVCFFQDVTTGLRAEAALRESEARFAAAFQGSTVAMAIGAADTGRYVELNPAFEEVTGFTREEALGHTPLELQLYVDPSDRERLLAALRTSDRPPAEEVRYRNRSGRMGTCLVSMRRISLHGEPHLLSSIVDVTDRTRAEEERAALQVKLAAASRMAALGTLVSGVAHEVNNPLAIVTASQGSALEEIRALQEAARRGASPDAVTLERIADELLEMLVDASTGAERIARIVKDLTIFGRPDPRRTRVRVADVVEGALKWLPSSVTARAEMVMEMGPAPDVLASAGQLEQVVVNLVSNAALAIPDGRRGRIVVRVGGGPGGTATVEVEDDGAGIPSELLERIFEPFFTTRGVGKGTGLGLPISHAIVDAHGGSLDVRSTVGAGSTFRVTLPAAAVPVEAHA